MDVNHVSALAGLAGALIGGLTSFGTTWITQKAQLHNQRMETARKQRERLFVEFMNEASRLYGDALGHEKDDIIDLVKLYAIAAHLRMVSSPVIMAAAERVIDTIVETYLRPNLTLQEMRDFAADGGLSTLRELANAFRAELAEFGDGLGPSQPRLLPA